MKEKTINFKERSLQRLRNPYFMITLIVVLVAIVSFASVSVFAEEGGLGATLKELAEQGAEAAQGDVNSTPLVQNSELFHLRSIIQDAIRTTIWWIIEIAYWLANSLEGLLKQMQTFFGFVEYVAHSNIYTQLISGVSVALLVATLSYIGIKNVLGAEIKYDSVVKNMVIVVVLIVGMPSLMGWMNQGAGYIWEAMMSGESQKVDSLSTSVIQENTYDLYIPLSGKTSFDELQHANPPSGLNSKEAINLVNINEYYGVEEKDIPEAFTKGDSDNWEVLQYSIVNEPVAEGKGYSNKPIIQKIEKSGNWFTNFFIGDTLQTGYYRYSFNSFYILATLCGLIIGFFTCLLTLARTYLEMGMQLIAGVPLMATDLETGQKVKHMMQTIINGFLTIAFTSLSFQLFNLSMIWMSENIEHPMLKLIGLIAAVMLLAQGSQTILSWYGVDLGMQEGFSMSKLFGAKVAGGLASKLFNLRKGKKDDQSDEENNEEKYKDNESLNESDNEEERENYRDGLSDYLNTASKNYGYMKNRGLNGMVSDGFNKIAQGGKDLMDGVGEQIQGKVNDVKEKASDISNSIKDNYKDGKTVAEQNRESMDNQRREKASEDIRSMGDHLAERSTDDNLRNIQDGLSKYQGKPLTRSQMDSLMQELEPARQMSKQDADDHIRQTLNKAAEDIKTPADVDSNDRQELNQILSAMNDKPAQNSQELRQNLDHALENSNLSEDKIQRIRQEVDKAEITNPENLRQRISQILGGENPERQELDQLLSTMERSQRPDANEFRESLNHALDQSQLSNDTVQKVRQEVERANISDPEDLRQRINQILGTDNSDKQELNQLLSNMETRPQTSGDFKQNLDRALDQSNLSNDTVQRIRQEVDRSQITNPEDLRQRINQMTTKEANISKEDREAIERVRQQFEHANLGQMKDINQTIRQRLEKEGVSPQGVQMIDQRLNRMNQSDLQRQRQEVEQVLRQNLSQSQAQPQQGFRVNTQGQAEIRQVLKQADFSQPEKAVQQVIRQVQNGELSQIQDARQSVVQELQKASQMYPKQAQSYTQEVLTKASQGNLSQQTIGQIKADVAPVRSVDSSIGQSIKQSSRQLYRVQGDTLADKTSTLAQGVYRSASSPEIVAKNTGKILSQSGTNLSSDLQQEITQKVRTIREEATANNTADSVVKQRVQQEINPMLSSSGLSVSQVRNLSQHVANASVGRTQGTEHLADSVHRSSIANPGQFRRNAVKNAGGKVSDVVQKDIEQFAKEAHAQNLSQTEIQKYVRNKIQQKDYGANNSATESQQRILNVVDESLQATKPQVQANLRKLGKLQEQFYNEDK
ncbi:MULTISPECIES: pLS20_p028 family conjugation system transmembrane protein [Aerococcus]|uniref:pLS20_p028 family conjugation system transmembrane protein n=1 Tax=Aerococcus TaxID=1375 RepID=UPI0018A71928|nr:MULTISPECIES: hypothetical protein [Aerococcus]MCY3067614.1 hypothetical protein [Aerococcus mictus]MCY3080484.1 hypothetical protein [Aerococcus mictus]MDK8484547.1 hypothetical protein [Aerococcus urinae]